MKYLAVILLPLLFMGCVVDHSPEHSNRTALRLYTLNWTLDGNHILVVSDTMRSDNGPLDQIRDYDKNGTLLQYYPFFDRNTVNSTTVLLPTDDDSTCFFSTTLSIGGDYTLYRYFLASGSYLPIAGGSIIAESSDARHLLIGSNVYPYNTNNFLVVDVSGSKPRLEKSWYDPVPQLYSGGVWIGSNHVGYLRDNSFNLVDFVITDTTGVKLDSFDVSGISDFYGIQVFHGPGTIYFSERNGIMKYDSAAKTSSMLVQGIINSPDISPDGSFIVYVAADLGNQGSLMVVNTKTGASKVLATTAENNIEGSVKVSPLGNQVAFIDNSSTYGGLLKILPVSAP